MPDVRCRFCGAPLSHVFCDLGAAPPSNAYLKQEDLGRPEARYPLKAWTCDQCFLTQIDEVQSRGEIFSAHYPYFSSFSSSWVAHAKNHVERMVKDCGLNERSLVVEIASNDGYLLQHVKALGIPCLGIEPTRSTASAAREKGIETREVFFGCATATQLKEEGKQADVIVANNVLAHVPDLHDFIGGFKILLKDDGVATFEFPHLMQLVANHQFDTLYHEHFSYLSLITTQAMMRQAGLRVFHVEEIPTHGGSLRIFVCHRDAARAETPDVEAVLAKERAAGMDRMAFYAGFQEKVEQVRGDFTAFLDRARQEGKTVAAYGAAAKGNTLLNYCGVTRDRIAFVCDLSPHKQGMFLPGSHIPILPPDELEKHMPDYVVILPWNLKEEITRQLAFIRGRGGRFVTAIPRLEIF